MKTGDLNASSDRPDLPQFSLTAGGPFHRLLQRLNLLDDDRMQMRPVVIVLVPLLAWLPLLVISALEGRLFEGGSAVPFLKDQEVHIRLLAALPLLLAAELVTSQRMRTVLQTFQKRKLVPPDALPRLGSIAAACHRLRDATLPEVMILAFVYGVGITIIWREHVALQAATWYATSSQDGSALTAAGWWYGYVSLPVFQFLLCRWYFRLFLWARFLWQASRLKLNLQPTHPDRVGGLSFIPTAASGMILLAIAHGALLTAYISSRVVQMGTSLYEFRIEAAVMVIYVLCIILGPLLFFSLQLQVSRRAGLARYGTLATAYTSGFDEKWLAGHQPGDEKLMGSADIQSLADLGNSYDLVRSMRKILVSPEDLSRFSVATLAPIAPLMLTVLPVEEIAKKLIGILL